ncbi:alkaline phosphatase [Collimonas sp. PA-H2]|uniref:alkaline phosphatase n=1 Tax=Collimonas sp. PA-H2 TaxID=1881062 RepID=UPI000BF794E4|nr:alkaline phosphatase [Collimonas sp. PA-H2]PFH09113.1 alkaline phosphatase [Collimonas sp. PA-H2]
MKLSMLIAAATASAVLAGCSGSSNSLVEAPVERPEVKPAAKNVIFFLGDGMGITTMTAARIYKVGEEGDLTLDTLPETGFVTTYSNDAQVTDSAPSMGAYMTGVKANNEVISMSANTSARDASGKSYVSGADSTCPSGNGTPADTLLEIMKAKGYSTGVVTTTRITHATPAATYSHICHRDGENNIAAQLTPKGAGFNSKLSDGVDVIFGGGRRHFLPKTDADSKRSDSRDLVAEFKAAGYAYAANFADFDKLSNTAPKVVGLFNKDHMTYDLDRDAAKEPSLAQMTAKSIDLLNSKKNGFFLMVEGGRIDHALHATNTRRALQETVAFDDAIKIALDKMQQVDPGLKNTLVVVTADHDHSILLNGYAKRTGKTTSSEPGVLGLVKNVLTGQPERDINNNPYTVIGFGNGPNHLATRGALSDMQVADKDYLQESVIPTEAGGETHGGTNVFIGAQGMGAGNIRGVLDNTEVFGLVKKAVGL